MKKREQVRLFLLGAITTVLVSCMIAPAIAAVVAKNIEVFPGVDIYIDDVKLAPKDANGNAVEAFIYDGTTYLPLRAIGEAFGYPVQWDGSTRSAYIGKHSSDKPAVMLSDLAYFTGSNWSKYGSLTDNLGN